MTAPEVVRMLQRAGWREVRRRGSHALFRHPSRKGFVVVPMHAGRTVKPRALAAILDASALEGIGRGVGQ